MGSTGIHMSLQEIHRESTMSPQEIHMGSTGSPQDPQGSTGDPQEVHRGSIGAHIGVTRVPQQVHGRSTEGPQEVHIESIGVHKGSIWVHKIRIFFLLGSQGRINFVALGSRGCGLLFSRYFLKSLTNCFGSRSRRHFINMRSRGRVDCLRPRDHEKKNTD